MRLAKRSFWIAAQTVARAVISQLTASHKPSQANETAKTHEPIRWTMPKGIRSSGGAVSASQVLATRLRAIRKAWHGKAMRKSCAAKAVTCEASAKAPVTGCIAIAAAMLGAAASRSGHGLCSLRGALESSSRLVLQP
eukprot:scaffold2960_cov61-Phaeocystis_antarctica.AAC.2